MQDIRKSIMEHEKGTDMSRIDEEGENEVNIERVKVSKKHYKLFLIPNRT